MRQRARRRRQPSRAVADWFGVDEVNPSSNEQWLPMPGYEDIYEISDHGRCRSKDRFVPHSRGGVSRLPAREIKGSVGSNSYRRFRLSRDGKFVRILAHRAVLIAFRGPAPAGMVGCHNDGDPSNNRLSNLRWDTGSANSLDSIRHGTHWKASVTHCSRGHRYVPESTLRHHGRRACRACVRANTAIRRRARKGLAPLASFQQLSDWAYADIVAGIDRRFRGAQAEGYWGPRVADERAKKQEVNWSTVSECPNGHEWTGVNTRVHLTPTRKHRVCRTCARVRARARRAAQREGTPYVDPFQGQHAR